MIVKTSQAPEFSAPRHVPLRHILARLAGIGIIPPAAKELDGTLRSAGGTLREAVLAEVPAYSASGNPEILPGLNQHGAEHVAEIRRLFGGGEIGDFAFIRTHAQHRAEQRFPLEAILHAYRCGHRVLSQWLREAAMAVARKGSESTISAIADFAIEYTNTISTIATSEYVTHTRLLAEAEGDLRTELLSILLSGYDESDGRVARLLKRAGYLDQRQSYCVVVAQSANPSEMENLPRAKRIVVAITEAVAGASIRTLAGIRNTLVTVVMSDRRRQSGWTAPQADLAERIHPRLLTLGPAVLIGVSSDQPSTSFLPKALHEATIALDFASVTNRVVQFSGLPIRALLVHRGTDYVRSAAPDWAKTFFGEDARIVATLVATLRAVADADMNIQLAARGLAKHPNTVYARLQRIKDLTGSDGHRYHDLVELLLAADCWPSSR